MLDFLRSLRSLTLRTKILLMILPTSLVSMAIAALIGYVTSRDALTAQSINQLSAIRSAKKAQVESYFRNLRDAFGVFADDVSVVAATQLFTDGFHQLGRQKLSADRSKALEAFYREHIVPDLAKTPGFEQMTAANLLPRTDRAAEAQAIFIAENPYPSDQRAKLLDAPVSNPYTLAHYTYHGWLRDLAERLKLYDLMIVAENGTIVYTVAKEMDFGTSLIDGPFAATNLGRLVRQVMADHRKGAVKLTDFEFYAASQGEPAMFIATPIYANFKLVGVLVGQLSIAELSRTMNGDKSWAADGLGTTGFAYITGESTFLRNDHREFVESREAFLKAAEAGGMKAEEIEAMRRQETTVLRYRMNNDGVRRALAGQTGTVFAPSSRGQPSLQAYAPLDVGDLRWVLVAQIDTAEIMAPLHRLERTMVVVACALALVATLLAMLLAAHFVRPIDALVAGIQSIKGGKTDVRIEKAGNDEFGRLTDSFNEMASAIRSRDEIIDGKNRAYAGLLNRIFPEVVADRMRSGEEQIVDTLPSVSLILASVTGFTNATAQMSGAASMTLLNEIVDTFDGVAARLGIERIKTFGEQYIAACGLAVPRLDHAARAVEFADTIASELQRIAAERGLALTLRACVASGKVHAGLVGNHRFVYEVWGRPLNLVERLIHETAIGEIRVTDDSFGNLPAANGFTPRPVVDCTALGRIESYGRSPRIQAASEVTSQAA